MTSSFTSTMSHSIVAALLLTMLLASSGVFWYGEAALQDQKPQLLSALAEWRGRQPLSCVPWMLCDAKSLTNRTPGASLFGVPLARASRRFGLAGKLPSPKRTGAHLMMAAPLKPCAPSHHCCSGSGAGRPQWRSRTCAEAAGGCCWCRHSSADAAGLHHSTADLHYHWQGLHYPADCCARAGVLALRGQ